MNTLGRDIHRGEVVILEPWVFSEKLPRRKRAFVCLNGQGMETSTVGVEILGWWLEPLWSGKIASGVWIHPKETICSEWISPVETAAFQKRHRMTAAMRVLLELAVVALILVTL